ncbi:MAG: hypothetical protein U9R64_01780, partial [Pseudomonadota bacterium]|nr:hypothetical protein [Pseudomonadota bacterium]
SPSPRLSSSIASPMTVIVALSAMSFAISFRPARKAGLVGSACLQVKAQPFAIGTERSAGCCVCLIGEDASQAFLAGIT